MKVLYILTVILLIIELTKRRFDFVSIAAVTYIFYTINCMIGQTFIHRTSGSIVNAYYSSIVNDRTYMCVVLQMFIIFLVLLISRKKVKFITKKISKFKMTVKINRNMKQSFNKKMQRYYKLMLIISYVIVIYNLFVKVGIWNFFSYYGKMELGILSFTDVSFAIWMSLIIYFYSIENNFKLFTILSGIIILFTVIAGSRAYLVVAGIGTIILRFKYEKKIIKNNMKIFILGLVAVILLVVYKLIYESVRALDFQNALNSLKNGLSLKLFMDIEEFRVVFSLYDYSVNNPILYPLGDSLVHIFSIIPFLNNVVPMKYPIRYSTYMTNFFHMTYGSGGNFWGEAYAMGGITFMLLCTLIWIVVVQKFNEKFYKETIINNYVLTGLIYCSFYIHRLDWIQVWGCIKWMIICYLLHKIYFNLRYRKV